ncbi:FAD synthetase family protein [Bacillus piscicola]|uniref:FAD synthetase family protein n=1 Tax=Bacillus piscicola TaxID=1632684 RepID=UPI001F090843|nr:FAD synthetase family protein [Bacillus piscicola]
MHIHTSDKLPELEGSVVTVGAFDGMHLGHQTIIRKAVKHGLDYGVTSVVYTFDPPPRSYFQQKMILTKLDEKLKKIKQLQVGHVIIAPFNAAYLQQSAAAFIHELKHLQPKEIIVGRDFRFGRDREGNIDLLRRHFAVTIPDKVRCTRGEVISSTRIRKLIDLGKTKEAVSLLGQ